ncbi:MULTISPECIES: sporulation protein YjcZ [Paenibacillus]|nr:sporulation protein YjcZ [Paenibacillus gorillae]
MSYGVGNAGVGCGGPVVGGAFTSVGVILVLFILLVIISRSFWC